MTESDDLELDVSDIFSALTAARDQSVFEVLEDMKRFDAADAMEEFKRRRPSKMRFDDVVASLRLLPELAGIEEPVFRKRARILTEVGMLLYAVTCDPLDGKYWVLAGVHCFANEDCDLERRNSFVLLDFEGHAAVVQSDIFQDAMHPSATGDVYLLYVYDVLIEGQDAPLTA
jgi:hypothetical protein